LSTATLAVRGRGFGDESLRAAAESPPDGDLPVAFQTGGQLGERVQPPLSTGSSGLVHYRFGDAQGVCPSGSVALHTVTDLRSEP
jgi:hypothetical protein